MASQTLVNAPARQPRVGGISAVADYVAEPRLGIVQQAVYISDGCTFPAMTLGLCYGQGVGTPVNEVQTVTITGVPTGGTFTLTFNGYTTTAIAYNATAATVQSALVALPNINGGNVVVTGGPGPGTPYTVTFTGTLGSANQPQMTATGSFTGGTSPAVAVTTATQGATGTLNTSVGLITRNSIASPFALYAGVECWLVEGNDYQERAQSILKQGSDRLLELQLATWAQGGTAMTGGDITTTIAQIEEDLDTNYLGQGVILMSRQDAVKAAAARAIFPGITVPTTANGTPVLASGSVALGKVSGLGAITVLYSDVAVQDALNPTMNREWAVANQAFAIIVDCDYRTIGTSTS